jgi:nitrogen-specific signal transduction histidine kinase
MVQAEAPGEREALLFALCHEVRNLLAASRLQAHFLDPSARAEELAATARRIAHAAARAGSLLAQVRPLFCGGEPAPASRTDPLDVLGDLHRELDDQRECALRVELKSAVGLPELTFDSQALHHILLTAVFDAEEAARCGGSVRVAAESSGDFVAFLVEDDGKDADPEPGAALCGRALGRAVAAAILADRGGRLEVGASEGLTRVALMIPTRSEGESV